MELKEWLLGAKPGSYSWGTMKQGFSGVHLTGLSVTLGAFDKEVGGREPLCMVSTEYLDELREGYDPYGAFGEVGVDDGRYGVLVGVKSDCVVWLGWDEEEEDFFYDVFVVAATGQELSEEARDLFEEDPDPVPGVSPGAISEAIGEWVRSVTGRTDLSFYYDDDLVPQVYLDTAIALLAVERGHVEIHGEGEEIVVSDAFFNAVALMGPDKAAELVRDIRSEMSKLGESLT